MLTGKKAVIFDMDGSLVDSMWIWPEVDRIFMEKYQLSEPATFHKDIEGMSYTERHSISWIPFRRWTGP